MHMQVLGQMRGTLVRRLASSIEYNVLHRVQFSVDEPPCTRASSAMGKETGAHVVPDLFVSWIQSRAWQSGG